MATSVRLSGHAEQQLLAAAGSAGRPPAELMALAALAAFGDEGARHAARAELAALARGRPQTAQDLASAVAVAAGFMPEMIIVTLGAATDTEPDEELGARTRVGWEPGQPEAVTAWAAAGRWRTRPAAYVLAAAAGTIRAVIKTTDNWRTDPAGRTLCTAPRLVRKHELVDLRTGTTGPAEALDQLVHQVAYGAHLRARRGSRNPVTRLRLSPGH